MPLILPFPPSQIMVPDPLSPLPDNLIKVIRNFAKQLEPWMQVCIGGDIVSL